MRPPPHRATAATTPTDRPPYRPPSTRRSRPPPPPHAKPKKTSAKCHPPSTATRRPPPPATHRPPARRRVPAPLPLASGHPRIRHRRCATFPGARHRPCATCEQTSRRGPRNVTSLASFWARQRLVGVPADFADNTRRGGILPTLRQCTGLVGCSTMCSKTVEPKQVKTEKQIDNKRQRPNNHKHSK